MLFNNLTFIVYLSILILGNLCPEAADIGSIA